MTDEPTEITIESSAETVPADDLGVDLENAEDPLNELRVALAERERPAWNVTTLIEIDPETAERYRPAFEQAVNDPDEELHDLVNNYAATYVQLSINGYDPEYYFEERSEKDRDRQVRRDVVDALEEADEPLSWDDLVDATGAEEDALDVKIEDLQFEDIVRYSGRGGGYVLHKDYTRDNDDV